MTGPAVLVVGAGPAGLSAARELCVRGVGPVVVAERDPVAGGVPRHCDHQGFGLQDLRRARSGPSYARLLVRRAEAAGARLVLSTTVTGITSDGRVTLVGPDGLDTMHPGAVVLATGARERPRSARLVPGDRPAGVFTTGQLQQWVLQGLPVGRRAVVVGAEHVSYSAVLTLRHAGVSTVAMVTELPRHQTLPAFASVTRWGLRVPLRTSARIVGLSGHGRLEGVEVEDLATGRVDRLAVDTIVFTGDWVPDHDLARRSGLVLDPATRGPATDAAGRTSRAGVLAAGNLVHPGETAGIAALGGRDVARRLADGGAVPSPAGVDLMVTGSLRSVVPVRVDPLDPPARLLLRTNAFGPDRLLVARQDGVEVGRHRLRHTTPHRSLPVPGAVVSAADATRGPITLSLV